MKLLASTRRLLRLLLTPITPGARRAVVALFVVTVALAGANLWWTAHTVGANNQKWCSLMITLDRANAAAKKPPAPGTFTAQFVNDITGLRRGLGC